MKLWVRTDNSHRLAPPEFQDAVARFARDNGGQTAEIVWIPFEVNCWQVKLYLKADDPRRKFDDPGTHFEPVMLHEWVDPVGEPNHPRAHKLTNRNRPGFVSLELEELGVEGLLDILRKGSLMSGRGEYASAEHALKASLRRDEERREKMRLESKDKAVTRWRDKRRQALKIPFLPVEIELRSGKENSV